MKLADIIESYLSSDDRSVSEVSDGLAILLESIGFQKVADKYEALEIVETSLYDYDRDYSTAFDVAAFAIKRIYREEDD